ncbi:MAG: glutamate--tRNA ligase family protein [Pseudomonadota bacterium]
MPAAAGSALRPSCLADCADGAPLSKRNGALSLRQLREQGYLPQAVANHLFRLGHSTPRHELLTFEEMAAAFEVHHLQRAPAHFDPTQLLGWQKEAVHRQSEAAARNWLGVHLPRVPGCGRRRRVHQGGAAQHRLSCRCIAVGGGGIRRRSGAGCGRAGCHRRCGSRPFPGCRRCCQQ